MLQQKYLKLAEKDKLKHVYVLRHKKEKSFKCETVHFGFIEENKFRRLNEIYYCL